MLMVICIENINIKGVIKMKTISPLRHLLFRDSVRRKWFLIALNYIVLLHESPKMQLHVKRKNKFCTDSIPPEYIDSK
jgi:hypothetical protein